MRQNLLDRARRRCAASEVFVNQVSCLLTCKLAVMRDLRVADLKLNVQVRSGMVLERVPRA